MAPRARGLGLLVTVGLVALFLGVAPTAQARTRPTDPTVAFAPVAPIGHAGRWLTDANGRVLLVHGVNVVAKTVGQTPAALGLSDDDAAWLVANGFEAVRLGTTAASIMPSPGVIDRAYVASFASTVKLLTAHGLLVLVDLHQDGWGPSLGDDGFPAWMTDTRGATDTHTTFPGYYVTNPAIQAAFDSFWDNELGPGGVSLQDRTATMWRALAGAVGRNPGVLGYDLINEPWPGTTWQPCLNAPGCPAQDAALDAYAGRATNAIRQLDPTHLIFGEPYVLFNFGFGPTTISVPGGDPNAGMSWHLYTDAAHEPAVIDFADQWSARTGGALLNTEFGAVTDPVAIDRMVGELDDALEPWLWWSYSSEIVPDLTQPPGGSNLDGPVADALARPHPVAVAGTPLADHYDEASRTLTFTWSTARAGGGTLPCGTLTSIRLPDRAYPHGFHVSVTGGVVVSSPHDGHLAVVANRGAPTVTVTVSPGRGSPHGTVAQACA